MSVSVYTEHSSNPRSPGRVSAGGVPQGGGRLFRPGLLVGVVVLAVGGLTWLGVFSSRDGPGNALPPPVLPTTTMTTTTTTGAVGVEVPVQRVRLGGGPFFERNAAGDSEWRGLGLVVAASTVVDGRVFGPGHPWDEGPVWWESGAIDEVGVGEQPRWIELDLGDPTTIDSAVVQADGNDEYLLSYRDLISGGLSHCGRPPHASFGGMQTCRSVFPEPVTTDLLRFEAMSGDGMYSVSEIQIGVWKREPAWGSWDENI